MALFPRQTRFFDLIEAQAENVVRGSRLLLACFEEPRDLETIAEFSRRIHDIEHEGDNLVHEVMARLNRTFITPLDREDIHGLCSRLDDIIDYIDSVAKRLVTYKVSRLTRHAVRLAQILEQATEEVWDGVRVLRDLRRHEEIMRQCTRINQLENDADQVLREALDELFNAEAQDPIAVIKWKDLYEHLEIATDKCEDVANIIEGVLIKYS
jgi:predicted phosphate transport protein (TIGR00153 family)